MRDQPIVLVYTWSPENIVIEIEKACDRANPVTNAWYHRWGEADKRKAANLLHTPYGRSRS